MAVAAELAAIGILVLIPLMYIQAIPTPDLTAILTLPPEPLPPPPPPAAANVRKTAPRRFNPGALAAPRTVPNQAPRMAAQAAPLSPPEAPELDSAAGGAPGGVPGGVAGGLPGSIPAIAPPPPLPATEPASSATPKRIHAGGNVQAAMLEHEVEPHYPKLASEARIGGVVRLSAVIARDGMLKI